MSATSTATKPAPAPTTTGGELAKTDPTPPVITTAEEYRRSVNRWAGKFHLLTPIVAFSGIAPQHGLMAAQVVIDHDPEHGEVYADPLFCKGGHKDPLDDEVAIAKPGLRKLALAGGWNLTSERLDPRTMPHYWEFRGVNRFIGLNGAVQELSPSLEYDLRDGSPRVLEMEEKARRNNRSAASQIQKARVHGHRAGEARAMNAACREFGVRQKYTRRELEKPFVVLQMMFLPDPTNEAQMRIVTERALQGTATLYPHAAGALPSAVRSIHDEDPPDEPVVVGNGRTAPQTMDQVPMAEPEPPSAPAIPEGMVLIKDIKVEQKKRRDGTGTFPKWTVIDSNGEAHVTIKREIGKALEDWERTRPLEIVSSENDYQELEIEQLIPGPDPRHPSLLTPDTL